MKKFFVRIHRGIRKFFSVVIIPNCIFNGLRIFLYRLCGYKIGKKCFIGMKCYLDDVDPKCLIIENRVCISYGVYFACHGPGRKHTPIIIKEGAYIGMRSSIIAKKDGGGGNNKMIIGKNAIIGACTLVNKDIPDECIALGVPCKILKNSESAL